MNAGGLRFLLVTFTLITFSNAGATPFIDGNRLVSMMREYEKANRGDTTADLVGASIFKGYVVGVADTFSEMICSPDNAKIGQYVAVVAKYLNDHPEQWNLPGPRLVAKGLVEAFPCRESPSVK
jgi:hypothetical protein